MNRTYLDRGILAAGLVAVLVAGCGDTNDTEVLDGGAPDARVPITFTYDNLIEACVRLAACGIQRQPRLSDCIDNFYSVLVENGQRELYERLYDCANKGKGSCKVIRNCLGFAARPSDPTLKCDSSTYVSKCVGNVAYSCDYLLGWEQKLDCTVGDLKCGVKDTGSGAKTAFCGGGSCNSSYKNKCVNNKQYKCNGGGIEINDCPEQQLQCRDPSTAECEGTGRSCKASNPLCKGNILLQCKNGYSWDIDCTKLPGKQICDATTNTCLGAGKECSEDSDFNTCEADLNTLVGCVDGYKKKFDCQKLGFVSCEAAATYGAYCKAEPVYELDAGMP